MIRARAALLLLVSLLPLSLLAQNAIPNPGGGTHTAMVDGQWGAPGTWSSGTVPDTGSIVVIPTGRTVTIAGVATGRPKWVRIDGILQMSTTASTKLSVETIHVTANGLLRIGTAAARINYPLKSEIVFISDGAPITRSWDPDEMSRGLIAEGKVEVYGSLRDYMKPVSGNVVAGATQITLQSAPAGWQQGDTIVLTGSTVRRGTNTQTDEKLKIGSIAGSVITIDATTPIVKDHLRVSTTNSANGTITSTLHVANLTRQVIFKSELADQVYKRGHVFLRHKDTVIENAAFENLGRTDKKQPLDDVALSGGILTRKVYPTPVANRRGRYAVHVHETPGVNPAVAPTTKIYGSVVNNTPGWGFANHSSSVDFQRNVAYDFDGAGFVTEDGDELGNFYDNIAIRGRGDGQYRKERINFNNAARPQYIADFAFNGDGFWFQGPAIRVNNAIANGCNGTGVMWHTTGTVDVGSGSATYPYGQYTYFPSAWLTTVYPGTTLQPRYWKELPGGTLRGIIIADLPVLQFSNVQAYGNLVGVRQRFNNHNSVDWYVEFAYDAQMQAAPNTSGDLRKLPTRQSQAFSNVLAWNNEQALGIRYAALTNWTTVTAVNRLDHDDKPDTGPWDDPGRDPVSGVEFNLQVQGETFNGLTIDGYEVAGWRIEGTRAMVITFTNTVYRNYANLESWDRTYGTEPGSPNHSLVASTSARISWTGTAPQYLVRYRVNNAQQWKYATATGTTLVNLTGLTPNTTYQYQVMAGNPPTMSTWTLVRAFTTTP
jgi:hypothetical protein